MCFLSVAICILYGLGLVSPVTCPIFVIFYIIQLHNKFSVYEPEASFYFLDTGLEQLSS